MGFSLLGAFPAHFCPHRVFFWQVFFWPLFKPHLPCQRLLSSTSFLRPLFVFLLSFVLKVYIVFYLYCTLELMIPSLTGSLTGAKLWSLHGDVGQDGLFILWLNVMSESMFPSLTGTKLIMWAYLGSRPIWPVYVYSQMQWRSCCSPA